MHETSQILSLRGFSLDRHPVLANFCTVFTQNSMQFLALFWPPVYALAVYSFGLRLYIDGIGLSAAMTGAPDPQLLAKAAFEVFFLAIVMSAFLLALLDALLRSRVLTLPFQKKEPDVHTLGLAILGCISLFAGLILFGVGMALYHYKSAFSTEAYNLSWLMYLIVFNAVWFVGGGYAVGLMTYGWLGEPGISDRSDAS